MEFIFSLFFSGIIGLMVLYFMLRYAISKGIDNSEEVRALKLELRAIKKQLKDISEKNETL
ncbi:hypothetical protein [Mesobacillus thioparans]|uniref:hypothetical protein n=1 Tax=Mesobacillus thioparans TaxID=370439 RepID=UPI0039F00C95